MGEMFNLGLLRRIRESDVIQDLEHTYHDINRLEHPNMYYGQNHNFQSAFSNNQRKSFMQRLGFDEDDNARKRQNIPRLQQRRTFQNDLRRRI